MEPRVGVLTVKQTAKLLQVSTACIYDALERKEIPGARKIGGNWRISTRCLFQWIDGEWPAKESAEAGTPAHVTQS